MPLSLDLISSQNDKISNTTNLLGVIHEANDKTGDLSGTRGLPRGSPEAALLCIRDSGPMGGGAADSPC